VERIAAEKIGRETAQYVASIFKCYVATTLAMESCEERKRTMGVSAIHQADSEPQSPD
jgi:hypothetical protein